SRPNILLLHAHFCHGATTVAWFVSQMTGLPFSFTAHAKDIYQKQLNPGRLLEQKLAAAQFVTTCTKTNHDYLTALHDENCPIHAVYHGINTKKFIPRTNYQLNVGQPLILAVGRHVEKKGFVYLIEACAKLHLANIDFQCLIIGESGDQTDMIKTTIQNKKLESQVVLRNAVTQEELRELYQQATIFALPCVITKDGDRDGIPNVMAEAMATGLPIVSTPISGIPELVEDQVNGLLVPPRDVEGLAGALKLLLADEMLRHKLGKAARQTICEQFDATVTIRSLQQLFQQALTYSKQHKPDNE
ncbi:MAG TPA: glycosyltransferase family 4 protein, partial [Nitrosomonas sp.]|nr:glycosyltransferase family 4 protein [Nitrosomonas sp.]